ncbi:uncharacterized protein LOC128993417 [Macrosteles quadrilineatus]|uniref:uncharacterized protein LOC128993417 n=1 Tax=Macrosteles quadrilineatus TaxID=74068 RepID=UPI0023E2ABA6|nr:uncharacterized protein LOC128993417 [Macrosteles quadrilineatus]
MFLASAILLVFIYNEAVRPVECPATSDKNNLVDTYAPLKSELNSAIFYVFEQSQDWARARNYEPLEEVPTRETYVCNAEVYSSLISKLQIVKIKKAEKEFVRLEIKFDKWTKAVPLVTYCTFQAYQGYPDDVITQDTVLFISKNSIPTKISVMLKTYVTRTLIGKTSRKIEYIVNTLTLEMKDDEDGRPEVGIERTSPSPDKLGEMFMPVDKMCAKQEKDPFFPQTVSTKREWTVWPRLGMNFGHRCFKG